MINYFIEFALIHLLLFGVYQLILRKETQLSFLRWYLLGSMLLALLLPVIKIPTATHILSADPTGAVAALLLPEIVISASKEPVESTTAVHWILWIFWSGTAIAALRLIFAFARILKVYVSSTAIKLNGCTVRHLDNLQSSFTFFKWIFIDQDHFKDSSDIIKHEEAHARYWHSVDLLLVNVLTVPFWWLPSIWLTIHELKKIHEYQADAFALQSNGTENYIHTLVESKLKYHGMSIANSFNDTPIIKRLDFMKRIKKNLNPLKVVGVSAFLAVTILTFSCEDKLESEISNVVEEEVKDPPSLPDYITNLLEDMDTEGVEESVVEIQHQSVSYSDNIREKLEGLQRANPEIEFKVVKINGHPETISKLQEKFIVSEIATYNNDEDMLTGILALNRLDNSITKPQEIQETDEIFTIVDEQPAYPGGFDSFYDYVVENLKYPEEAKEMGIEGKIFVQFIVDKDGTITDAQVIRGIGVGCDEEALRVIRNSPKWIPGKQRGIPVKVRMVMPIVFKLSPEE